MSPLEFRTVKPEGDLVSYENWGLVFRLPGLITPDFSKVFFLINLLATTSPRGSFSSNFLIVFCSDHLFIHILLHRNQDDSSNLPKFINSCLHSPLLPSTFLSSTSSLCEHLPSVSTPCPSLTVPYRAACHGSFSHSVRSPRLIPKASPAIT